MLRAAASSRPPWVQALGLVAEESQGSVRLLDGTGCDAPVRSHEVQFGIDSLRDAEGVSGVAKFNLKDIC